MANTILIDGIDFTDSIRFPDGFQVTYAVDDSSKTQNVGISSGIVFNREAFNYLEEKFFPVPFDPKAKDREAEVRITTDICNQEYNFIVRADAVTYCPERCSIEAEGFERSDDFKSSARLRNEIILSKRPGGLIGAISPKVRYCLQSNFFQKVLYVLVQAVITPLLLGAAILATLGFTGVLTALQDFLGEIIGCRGSIRTFYIRDIIDESAGEVGLTFESSILKDDPVYSNAAWLDTRAISGIQDDPGNFSNDGQSRLSATEFLDLLGGVFNADWRITNGVLIFERVDFFNTTNNILVNVDESHENGKSEESACYEYTDQTRPAYGRYRYSEDNGDAVGNSGLPLYDEIIDFNIPFDINKSGSRNVSVPLNATRFVGDGIDGDGDFGTRTEGDLLLEHDSADQRSLPKILILTGYAADTSDPNWENAKVISRVVDGQRQWNYPMWMLEDDPQGLFEPFWRITDPRETPNRPYELQDYEFQFTCEQVNLIRDNGLNVLVETPLGNGKPEEITIDFDRKTIKVSGTKLSQS